MISARGLRQLQATAYHEAGHVAALFALGRLCELERASIIPKDGTPGSCDLKQTSTLGHAHDVDLWQGLEEPAYVRMLEHSTIFWLAGRAAEARFLGTSTETVLECGADLEEAHEYCGHLSDTGYRGGDLEEIFAEMNRRAIGLFSSSQIWDFTQSVAEALLDRGALDYEDVINATKKRKG